MKHIFGNLKPYLVYVVVIVALLIAQAFCDFSLPDYTSKLINTAIMNDGIEYAAPTQLTYDTYCEVSWLMKDEESEVWNKYYSYDSDKIVHLSDDVKPEEINDILERPLAAYMLYKQAQASMGDMSDLSVSDQMLYASMARKEIDKKLDEMGESMVSSYAISFTKSEYEKTGIDLVKMRSAYLWKTGGKMLLIAVGMMAIAIAVGFLASKVGAGVGRDLREKVFKKVVGFSDAEINKFSTASLITRTTNDVQQVQNVTVMLLRMVLYAPVMAVGGIIMVVRTGAKMGYIIVIAVVAIFILMMVLFVVAMPKFKLMQKLVDRVNLVSREILTGLPVIRAFGREKHEEERFDKANKDLTDVMLFTNRVMSFMMPALMIIMNVLSIVIVWVGAHRVNTGNMEIGTMTAFITYTMMIIMAFLMLTMVSIMLPRAGVAADRIDEVLKTEPTIHNAVSPETIDDKTGVVSFKHVSFHYPDASGNVIEDIDFVAEPGTTTAIIGSTGCGKSTLVNLIPRFFDVTDGSITIDNINVKDIDIADLRHNIGYVPQKGVLFSGTIASNIKFGQVNDSDEDMFEAAQIAQAEEFIEEKSEK